MRTSDFDYKLPRELIAQYPAERRDKSRLLVLNREEVSLDHRHFRDVVDYVEPGDVLVVNDSRVIPARLLGRRSTGGKAEMFLLARSGPGVTGVPPEATGVAADATSVPADATGVPTDGTDMLKGMSGSRGELWEVLVRPGARIREGAVLTFGDGLLSATIREVLPEGRRIVELNSESGVAEAVEKLGQIPLPPPTAGLHFTDSLLGAVQDAGATVARLTLHVGIGTFRPVTAEDPEEHRMESERYVVSADAAREINRAREAGGRVFAVGTTAVRTLESVTDDQGHVSPATGSTELFIRPPYRFKCVDALITNFHLPRSTLLMLVSAFGGRERVLAAYQDAVLKRYRFYSYGDAMLIL